MEKARENNTNKQSEQEATGKNSFNINVYHRLSEVQSYNHCAFKKNN